MAAIEEREIETPGSVMRLGVDGVLRITLKPNTELSVEELRKQFELGYDLCGGRRGPLLVDSRAIRSITREARAYICGEEAARAIQAQAILVDSPVSRMIGSFFLGLSKPRFPLKLFTSEPEALEWLREVSS